MRRPSGSPARAAREKREGYTQSCLPGAKFNSFSAFSRLPVSHDDDGDAEDDDDVYHEHDDPRRPLLRRLNLSLIRLIQLCTWIGVVAQVTQPQVRSLIGAPNELKKVNFGRPTAATGE